MIYYFEIIFKLQIKIIKNLIKILKSRAKRIKISIIKNLKNILLFLLKVYAILKMEGQLNLLVYKNG